MHMEYHCVQGPQGVIRVGLVEDGPVKKGYLGQVSQRS